MIKIVDRNGDKVVQKVTTPKGELVAYQSVAVSNGSVTVLDRHKTLAEARANIGKFPPNYAQFKL